MVKKLDAIEFAESGNTAWAEWRLADGEDTVLLDFSVIFKRGETVNITAEVELTLTLENQLERTDSAIR